GFHNRSVERSVSFPGNGRGRRVPRRVPDRVRQWFPLPFHILDEFRFPGLRLDGDGQRSGVGRYFRVVASAAQAFELYIDRVDAVALDEFPGAGRSVASDFVVDAEREIGRLAVVCTV